MATAVCVDRHVDLFRSPRELQQYHLGPRGRSVGRPAMQSGKQHSQPWQHQKLTTGGLISNLTNEPRIDKRAQKEVVKFATTRCALPPTPPSTATSSSSSSSRSGRSHVPDRMDPASRRAAAAGVLPPMRRNQSFPRLLDEDIKRASRRPFSQKYGRRYTRDASYPLPCDVPELQRQNLRTSLACTVFGKPICSSNALQEIPETVLELGCGTGYWSAACHQAFASIGHDSINFTGMDIVPVAPDLKQQGLNWKFVQHDMRRTPWPFEDASFDFIMWKDLSLVINAGSQMQRVLDECVRVLRVGGTLEIWEHDNLIRCMQPHTAPPCRDPNEEKVAAKTATYPITASTPFAPSRNRYLRAANKWIDTTVGRRGLISAPCTRMATLLLQEPQSLGDFGTRRVAIPLSGLNPARDAQDVQKADKRQRSRSRARESKLNRDQQSLRQTALLTVVQLIESLEPLLKETSGKNNEEWSAWWASMMSSLTSTDKKTLSGECLEVSAWWATKLDDGLS